MGVSFVPNAAQRVGTLRYWASRALTTSSPLSRLHLPLGAVAPPREMSGSRPSLALARRPLWESRPLHFLAQDALSKRKTVPTEGCTKASGSARASRCVARQPVQ